MIELKDIDETRVVDYMARDYRSLLASMRGLIDSKLPEWTDNQSEADFGNVMLQLFAHMGDILSYHQERIANESFLGTARERRSIIQHLRLIDYKLSTAFPASTTLLLTIPAACVVPVVVSRGDAFATKSSKEKPSVRFEYNGPDLTIDCAALPIDPLSGAKHFELPVEEGRLVLDEVLGVSNGAPNQRFPLAVPGLILRSSGSSSEVNLDIELLTEVGGLVEGWTLQDSLAFSRAGERDYVIEIDENDIAMIVFGGADINAIPATGSEIRATYRVGGGESGNVAANTIVTLLDAAPLTLNGISVSNPTPATGGAERESIEHAVDHAPQIFKSLRRAVTRSDYEKLALQFNGVGKVRAEPGNWNTMLLFVAPQGGGEVSDILQANLLAFFEDKRPLSTIVEIRDVDYVRIYVDAEVELEGYYSQIEKREEILEAAGKLLDFDEVDFASPVYLSKFFEAIEAIDGVNFVNIRLFRREGVTAHSVNPDGKIELAANEIPRVPGTAVTDPASDSEYAGGVKLEITGGY